jgi:hypothetical protein
VLGVAVSVDPDELAVALGERRRMTVEGTPPGILPIRKKAQGIGKGEGDEDGQSEPRRRHVDVMPSGQVRPDDDQDHEDGRRLHESEPTEVSRSSLDRKPCQVLQSGQVLQGCRSRAP